jgi:16S rRNA (guanine527-N7)-methyltransferase
MPGDDLATRMIGRAGRLGVVIDPDLARKLASYVALLAQWNERINLTALPLTPASDAAIDRLIVEPVAAARFVGSNDRHAIDIGSGGGSPGIPFALAAPAIDMRLVEIKSRKAAFLRTVVREMSLNRVHVEHADALSLGKRREFAGAFDVVTMRAVRPDHALIRAIETLLMPSGRFFWFAASELSPAELGPKWDTEVSPAIGGSEVSIHKLRLL